MKRFLIELVWFCVIVFVLMTLVSFALSTLAPGADQQTAGRKLTGPIAILSIILTVIGAKLGWLPGTKKKNPDKVGK